MSLQTLNDIFFAIAGREQPELRLQRAGDSWQPSSSRTFTGKVTGVVAALRSWGISKGDRVAILSENRYEWVVADFASLLLGAVVVPIYTTLTAEQIAYLLRDSGPRVIFVSTEQHMARVLSIREQTSLEKIVVMDHVASENAVRMSAMAQSSSGSPAESIARVLKPDDLATIIY